MTAGLPVAAWARAVRDAGGTASTERIATQGNRLVGRWAEPHRRYHDAGHLRAVLDRLDLLSAPQAPPATVRLAAWFHDAVHDGVPGADEEASAALADQVLAALDVPVGVPTEVARLVRLTADHEAADDDPGGRLLIDADLAILAAPAAAYRHYARAVRAEYAHLTQAEFTAGRLAVLTTLLERPQLFRTELGARLWDGAARANLAAEIDRLSGGGR